MNLSSFFLFSLTINYKIWLSIREDRDYELSRSISSLDMLLVLNRYLRVRIDIWLHEIMIIDNRENEMIVEVTSEEEI